MARPGTWREVAQPMLRNVHALFAAAAAAAAAAATAAATAAAAAWPDGLGQKVLRRHTDPAQRAEGYQAAQGRLTEKGRLRWPQQEPVDAEREPEHQRCREETAKHSDDGGHIGDIQRNKGTAEKQACGAAG